MEITDPRVVTLRSKELALAWLQGDDRLDDICGWIEGGGSLITMCDLHEINYSTVMRWIKNTDHKERSRAYDDAIEARKEWMVETIVNELREISFVDIRKAFDDEGNLLDIHKMPDDVAKALSAVDIDERGKIKIRLWDKLAAIEKLGKNLKMFIDRVEHTGVMTLEKLVEGTIEDKPKMETVIEIKPEIEGDGKK